MCERAEGVSSAPGALEGELRAKPEPTALRSAGPLCTVDGSCWCYRGRRRRRALRLVAVVQKMFLRYSRLKKHALSTEHAQFDSSTAEGFFFFFPFSQDSRFCVSLLWVSSFLTLPGHFSESSEFSDQWEQGFLPEFRLCCPRGQDA